MSETAVEKRMKLRYAGVCRLCEEVLAAGAEAIYEKSSKTVRCIACPRGGVSPQDLETCVSVAPAVECDVLNVGTPGASARREFERRQAKREERIRQEHPRIGGLILALSDEPQSTTAWDTGALGEERLGTKLNGLASDTVRVLHDRRIPGSKANIDHIAVTPTGIYVIDAKRYKGRPHLKVEGGILRQRVETLMIGSRSHTKLVDGVLEQVDVVRNVVGDGVAVTGVLCFVEADWPLIGGAFVTQGVEVLWPKKLYPRLTAEGPHVADVAALHQKLAAELPLA